MTEREVMVMLGAEDREELYELFKRFDMRGQYADDDFEREDDRLEDLLSRRVR